MLVQVGRIAEAAGEALYEASLFLNILDEGGRAMAGAGWASRGGSFEALDSAGMPRGRGG